MATGWNCRPAAAERRGSGRNHSAVAALVDESGAEGLDPNNPAVVGALEPVRLELGRADPNLRRQRAGPTLCTPNRCEIWIRPKERQED